MKLTFNLDGHGQSVATYLQREQCFSQRLLKKLRYQGQVIWNGESVKLRHQLIGPGKLEVLLPEEGAHAQMPPVAKPLTIVYEDDALIVVDKPAGLLSVPSARDQSDSLVQRLLAHYQATRQDVNVAHIVNRLDKGTCGLVLFAKNHYCKQQLQQQTIKKRYYALACGDVNPKHGELTWPIARGVGIKRVCTPDGAAARTHYRVLATSPTHGMSLVDIELKSGRTHQIRVHFATLGFPLVNDYLYGNAVEGAAAYLQSYALTFVHPITYVEHHVELPLAQRLQNAWQMESDVR